MPVTPDLPFNNEPPAEIIALRRELSDLMQRWQQAGISLHELAMILTTTGCQALGHAMGEVPPPEGPELLQHIIQQFQRQAEACYFQHWGDTHV